MTKHFLDSNGQPPDQFNTALRQSRDINELLGFCRGILSDGMVNKDELASLNTWIQSHPDALCTFPAAQLSARIKRVHEDSVVSEQELEDFRLLLESVTGAPGHGATATAVLDEPPPVVLIEGRQFCLTGSFVSGSRGWCENELVGRGATVCGVPGGETDYLVVGSLGSKNWKHTSFGNKIKRAMELKPRGRIAIVSEEGLMKALSLPPP